MLMEKTAKNLDQSGFRDLSLDEIEIVSGGLSAEEEQEIVVTAYKIKTVVEGGGGTLGFNNFVPGITGVAGNGYLEGTMTLDVPVEEEELETDIVVTAPKAIDLGDGYTAYIIGGVYSIYHEGILSFIFGESWNGYFVPGTPTEHDLVIDDPTITVSTEYKGATVEVEINNETKRYFKSVPGPGGGHEPPMPEM